MSTLGDLVTTISSSLHSFTGLQELSTWLTSGINSTVTLIPVSSGDTVIRGIAEIDDELIYVHSSDATGLTLAPFGRGYRGSTAASHSANAQVIVDPIFPKLEIKRAINQCIEGLYPQLYQIKTTTLTYSASVVGYSLPADCDGVVQVKSALTTDPLNYWNPISRWSYDAASPLTNGRALNIIDSLPVGSSVKVSYMSKFGTFASDASTLASIGLPESYADLVLYGTASRMLRFLDPARLQVSAVENLSRSGVVASGDAGKIANQLYAMYQQRVSEEREKLLDLTPPQIHFSR